MNQENPLPTLSVELSLKKSEVRHRIQLSSKYYASQPDFNPEFRHTIEPEFRAKEALSSAIKTSPRKRANFKAWADRNKAHLAAYARKRRKEHPEKYKPITRRAYAKHRDKKLSQQAEWRRKNPEKLKAGQKRYFDHRMATDPAYRLRHQLRSHIRVKLKLQGVIKSRKTLDLLGCTSQFWREYLEAKFLPGMTWDNYGAEWQIDHIIPLVKFDLSDVEQQKRAFHYSNTQPMWTDEHRLKSDSMPGPHQALLI